MNEEIDPPDRKINYSRSRSFIYVEGFVKTLSNIYQGIRETGRFFVKERSMRKQLNYLERLSEESEYPRLNRKR